MSEELTAEEINGHFSAMNDSVNLINDTIADDTVALETHGSAEEVKLMMKRNTDHLEIQLDNVIDLSFLSQLKTYYKKNYLSATISVIQLIFSDKLFSNKKKYALIYISYA